MTMHVSGGLRQKYDFMMKVFEFVEVVASFHYYMMRGHTGDAGTFSKKIGISRSCLYNLINELKDYGIDIEYCREEQSFRYLHPEKVEIKISIIQH